MIDAKGFGNGLSGRQLVGSFLLAAGIALLVGCDHSSNTPAAAPTSQPAAQAVTLRGVIKELPSADSPFRLVIHNEPSKEMSEMTMSFSADPALKLTGLAVGDIISFDWVEDGDRIIQIKKLPADTVLSFELPQTKPATQP